MALWNSLRYCHHPPMFAVGLYGPCYWLISLLLTEEIVIVCFPYPRACSPNWLKWIWEPGTWAGCTNTWCGESFLFDRRKKHIYLLCFFKKNWTDDKIFIDQSVKINISSMNAIVFWNVIWIFHSRNKKGRWLVWLLTMKKGLSKLPLKYPVLIYHRDEF